MSKPNKKAIDADPDLDEDGELDVEQFAINTALLTAAGIESDEDWDAIPAAKIPDLP